MNFIFSKFLFTFYRRVNEQAFKELCIFVCVYRKSLNLYAKKFLNFEPSK